MNSSGQTVPPPEGGGQQAGRHPGPGAGEVQPRPKGRPGPSGSGGEEESGDRGELTRTRLLKRFLCVPSNKSSFEMQGSKFKLSSILGQDKAEDPRN